MDLPAALGMTRDDRDDPGWAALCGFSRRARLFVDPVTGSRIEPSVARGLLTAKESLMIHTAVPVAKNPWRMAAVEAAEEEETQAATGARLGTRKNIWRLFTGGALIILACERWIQTERYALMLPEEHDAGMAIRALFVV